MASTSSTGVGLGIPDGDACRAEVAAVLALDAFRRSPKLSRLLVYLCDKQLGGMSGEITEYAIAMEVLGRGPRFDPQQDAVVRVDTLHLRKRLKDYYAGEGAGHKIRIVIPNGRYAPEFVQQGSGETTVVAPPPAAPEVQPQPVRPRRIPARVLIAAAVVAATVIPWTLPQFRQAVLQRIGRHPVAGVPVAAVAGIGEIRIAAGERAAPYIDSAGRTWMTDRNFTGGATFHRPEAPIARTADPELFQNGREGQFVYAIPLHPGVYELHLCFAETGVASDTLRNMDIAINGQPGLGLDVASDAGGIDTATEKIFKDVSPGRDGYLHLMFQGGEPKSFLNAIEIVPGTPGKMRPIRITAGDRPFRDHLGATWLPDRWFAGGRKSTRAVPIGQTADAGLYQWERVGHFSYSIPVAQGGLYTVALHFSETWFTPQNSAGGPGSRVFDVYCNGRTLLQHFDILQEAGGVGNRAVVREFHNVPASPLGKIDLEFVPIANYALINAIEIIEE